MPNVAIAGGTSPGLGRAMVLAILETYPHQEWKPIILSRRSEVPLWLQAVDPEGTQVQMRQVDYLNETQLASSLQGVHTLISVVLAKDGSQAQVQLALLRGALAAGCKRYAPAHWAGGLKSWERVWMLRMAKEGVWEECEKHADRIECALFNNGMFLNYFGIGAFEQRDNVDEQTKLKLFQQGAGYMQGDDAVCQGVDKEGDMPDGLGAFVLSLATGTAQIPMRDDGGYPSITLTLIRDVGRYVAAALNLERWEKEMNMVGETIRTDKLLALAESISGKPISVEKLTRPQIESEIKQLEIPKDIMKQLWLELKLEIAADEAEGATLTPTVNQLCPDVRPTSVAEYLQLCWADKKV